MASGMSIASNNLRHSGSVFILLRAVQICAALLTQTEVESERAESEGVELNTGVGFGWGACGGMSMDVRIHLRVNKHTGGLEGLPA